MRRWLAPIVATVFGLIVGSALTAQSFERWQRSQVTPVVLVKPELGSFVPIDGTFIDGEWTKDQVIAMVQVEPSIGGFQPVTGSRIGNTWTKQQVDAVVLVKPDGVGFTVAGQALVGGSSVSSPGAANGSGYGGVGRGHWIRENGSGGALITLEDGSLWEVSSMDRIDTALWLPTSNITVLSASSPIGGYNFILINTDDREKAAAKYLGKR